MPKLKWLIAPVVAMVVVAAGCGGSSSSGDSSSSTPSTSSETSVLVGAGSTLVAPLMAQWQPDYSKSAAAVTVTYGAIGSGGGVDAITNRTVDFGASDAPLTPDQATACKNCLQVPWALGATVVTYNVSGVSDKLHLSGEVVSKIYQGQITSWNDPAIAALNSGVTLPDTHITPIYRSDSSGDSWVFTSYLSAVDPAWKSAVGASTSPSWPSGNAAEKNSGVAAAVAATNGSIGYVAVSYIAADELNEALLQNQAGQFPEPTTDAILAAAKANTTINSDGSVPLVNPPASAPDAYPMSTYTYAIVPQDAPHGPTLAAFLTYAITKGQAFGPDLGFPALPASIVAHDKTVIAKIK